MTSTPVEPSSQSPPNSDTLPQPEAGVSVNTPGFNPSTGEFTTEGLLPLKNQCNSRRNFALKQAELIFSKEVRLVSNCTGKKGKLQLDPVKLEKIKESTFKVWPLDPRDNEKDAWQDCKRAIDEGGRQLNQRMKKLMDRSNFMNKEN